MHSFKFKVYIQGSRFIFKHISKFQKSYFRGKAIFLMKQVTLYSKAKIFIINIKDFIIRSQCINYMRKITFNLKLTFGQTVDQKSKLILNLLFTWFFMWSFNFFKLYSKTSSCALWHAKSPLCHAKPSCLVKTVRNIASC